MQNEKGYQENATQKQRLLDVLREGKAVTQINLKRYLALLDGRSYPDDGTVDALADLGIANLPARIFGLKEDGYLIKTDDIKVEGRFCETHYASYRLLEEPPKKEIDYCDGCKGKGFNCPTCQHNKNKEDVKEEVQGGLFPKEKPWYLKEDKNE